MVFQNQKTNVQYSNNDFYLGLQPVIILIDQSVKEMKTKIITTISQNLGKHFQFAFLVQLSGLFFFFKQLKFVVYSFSVDRLMV